MQARQFYLSRGFMVINRSSVDGQGRPYPILHLEYVRKNAAEGEVKFFDHRSERERLEMITGAPSGSHDLQPPKGAHSTQE